MAEIEERLEIIRRICERGQKISWSIDYWYDQTQLIDIFQHLLNEIEVTKKSLQELKNKN